MEEEGELKQRPMINHLERRANTQMEMEMEKWWWSILSSVNRREERVS